MSKLDFICIGAAKSGTTTLHELLKNHPEIALPKAKEVPYFNDRVAKSHGFEWYLKQNFSKEDLKSKKCGTFTPQYMYYREIPPHETAQLIHKQLPSLKIIAILRNPLDRSFSHFKTSIRRQGEKRTFYQAAADLLRNKKLPELRNSPWSPDTLFLFGSEYGKLLKPYYELYPKKNILILFMDELENGPEKALGKICKFIGVDSKYTPPNLGKQFNRGGVKPKVALLTPQYIYKIPGIRKIWRTLIPYKARKYVEVKINSWNAKPDKTKFDRSSDIYRELISYFKEEVKQVEELSGIKTPWSEFK